MIQETGKQTFADAFNGDGAVEQSLEEEAQPGPNIEPTPQVIMNNDTIEPEVLPYRSGINLPAEEPLSVKSNHHSIGDIGDLSYIPRGTSIPELSPTGNLWQANLAEGTSWGYFMNNRAQRDYKLVDRSKFNFVDFIPDDLKAYPGAFALDMSEEEIQESAAILREELFNEETMAAHPWQSAAIGFATQAIDPVNLLPGGLLYKNFKQASITTRAMAGTAISNVTSSTIQEGLLHSSQLTRTSQESVWNIAASGVLGGALGAGFGMAGELQGTLRGARARLAENLRPLEVSFLEKAHHDIEGVFAEYPVPLTDKGLLAGSELEYMPKWVQKAMIGTPLNRSKTGAFKTPSLFADYFIESNYNTVRHANGETLGNAVETNMRLYLSKGAKALSDIRQQYYDMVGVKGTYFKQLKTKLAKPEMSWDEFASRVTRVIFSKAEDSNAHVNKAAAIFNRDLIDPSVKDLVALGKLPEGVNPKTAPGYFTIVPNKQKIIEEGGSTAWGPGTYPQAIFDGLVKTREAVKKFKQNPVYKAKSAEIEKLLNQQKKARKAEKSTINRRIEELNAEIREIGHPYLFDLDGKLWDELPDDVLETMARQVVDKQLAQVGDKLLNPILDKLNASPKQLKDRTLMIDQADLHEWHIKDPIVVGQLYLKAMAPVITLNKKARELGFENIDDLLADFGRALKEEYDELLEEQVGKSAAKLEKEFRRAQEDMKATIEILQGTYGQGDNVLSNKLAVFARNFRTFTAMRFLGGMMISSFSDIGQNVFRNGPFQFIYHGLVPVLRSLDTMSRKDLRAIGRGMDSEIGAGQRSFLDTRGLTTNPGIISKSFDYLADSFSNATGMNPWNSIMQRLAGSVSLNRTLDTIARVVEGKKVSAKDRKRVAQLGIDEKHFEYIYSQTKDNIDPETNSRYADWTEWDVKNSDEAQALNEFQAATLKDIDTTVIKPTLGDKPLFAHTQWGQFGLQFKSFSLSATNKILYSGIQRRHDANMYMGVSMMLAMGAMSYVTMKLLRGEEPDLSFETLSAEAIDRSGLLGIFGEVWNIGQKAGIIPGEGVSRYASRGILGAFIGPSLGSADDASYILNRLQAIRAGDSSLTTSDVQKAFRFIPYQNLFYLQYLNKLIIRKIGQNYDLEETRKEP